MSSRELERLSIVTYNNIYSCGGSILSENWVLSAGHCCYGIDGGEIAAGINDRFDNDNAHLTGFTKFLHPDYNPSNTNNDVCLLKVDKPFDFANNTRLGSVKLNTIEGDWEGGTKFTVTGWGTTSVSREIILGDFPSSKIFWRILDDPGGFWRILEASGGSWRLL